MIQTPPRPSNCAALEAPRPPRRTPPVGGGRRGEHVHAGAVPLRGRCARGERWGLKRGLVRVSSGVRQWRLWHGLVRGSSGARQGLVSGVGSSVVHTSARASISHQRSMYSASCWTRPGGSVPNPVESSEESVSAIICSETASSCSRPAKLGCRGIGVHVCAQRGSLSGTHWQS